jgi:hypothetical protein
MAINLIGQRDQADGTGGPGALPILNDVPGRHRRNRVGGGGRDGYGNVIRRGGLQKFRGGMRCR